MSNINNELSELLKGIFFEELENIYFKNIFCLYELKVVLTNFLGT